MTIILASQSPRRKEILEQMGFSSFLIRPAAGEEAPPNGLAPEQYVMALSAAKCREVAVTAPCDGLIIAADTIVCIDDVILGKPHTEDEATHMLKTLSGRSHTVFTGVTVMQNGVERTAFEQSDVFFHPLTDADIKHYIATGEPMDKAGSYGVQGYGAMFVERIEGDYFNVMGLPICKLAQMLKQFGVDPLEFAAEKGHSA